MRFTRRLKNRRPEVGGVFKHPLKVNAPLYRPAARQTLNVSDVHRGYRAHQDAAALQQMIQTQILPAAQIL